MRLGDPDYDEDVSLRDLAASVDEWQERVFPDHRDPHVKGCKVAEEAGEVCGAIVKLLDGRKRDEDVMDEIGDVVISLAGLCGVMHYDFAAVVAKRWSEVSQRTYSEAHERGRTTDG